MLRTLGSKPADIRCGRPGNAAVRDARVIAFRLRPAENKYGACGGADWIDNGGRGHGCRREPRNGIRTFRFRRMAPPLYERGKRMCRPLREPRLGPRSRADSRNSFHEEGVTKRLAKRKDGAGVLVILGWDEPRQAPLVDQGRVGDCDLGQAVSDRPSSRLDLSVDSSDSRGLHRLSRVDPSGA